MALPFVDAICWPTMVAVAAIMAATAISVKGKTLQNRAHVAMGQIPRSIFLLTEMILDSSQVVFSYASA